MVEAVFAQLDPAISGMGIFKTRIFGKPAGDGIAPQPSFEEKFKAQLALKDLGGMQSEIDALKGNMHSKKADRGSLTAALSALEEKLAAVEETAPAPFVRSNSARYFDTQRLLEAVQGDLEDILTDAIAPLFVNLSNALKGVVRHDQDPAYPVLQYMCELSESRDMSTLFSFLNKVLSELTFEASKTMKMGGRMLPLNAIRGYALALLKENREDFDRLKGAYELLKMMIEAYVDGASKDVSAPAALVEGFVGYEVAVRSFREAREALGDTSTIADEKHRSLLEKLRDNLLVYVRPGQVVVLQGGLLDQEDGVQKGPMTPAQKNFYKAGQALISKWTLMRTLNPKLGVFHGM